MILNLEISLLDTMREFIDMFLPWWCTRFTILLATSLTILLILCVTMCLRHKKKSRLPCKRNGLFYIDLKKQDVDFTALKQFLPNYRHRTGYGLETLPGRTLLKLSMYGFAPFLKDANSICYSFPETELYIYDVDQDTIFIYSEKLYTSLVDIIEVQRARIPRFSYDFQIQNTNTFCNRSISGIFNSIQKRPKGPEFIDFAFKNFHHPDRESIISLFKSKSIKKDGGMYFFTGSTGTGKSELSKIIMHIFDNIADNVTTKVYCDKTTDFVSVLDSFASTYNDINSHVIVFDEFDKMIDHSLNPISLSESAHIREQIKSNETLLAQLNTANLEILSKPATYETADDAIDNKKNIEHQTGRVQKTLDELYFKRSIFSNDNPRKVLCDKLCNLFLTKLPALTANNNIIIFTMNDFDKFFEMFSRDQQNLFRDQRAEKISFLPFNSEKELLKSRFGFSGSNLSKLLHAFKNPYPFTTMASFLKCMEAGLEGKTYNVGKIIEFIKFNRQNQMRFNGFEDHKKTSMMVT